MKLTNDQLQSAEFALVVTTQDKSEISLYLPGPTMREPQTGEFYTGCFASYRVTREGQGLCYDARAELIVNPSLAKDCDFEPLTADDCDRDDEYCPKCGRPMSEPHCGFGTSWN